MSERKKDNKIKKLYVDERAGYDEDEEGGGQSGAIQFKEFISTGPLRDDLLSPEELTRLHRIHSTESELHIRKAKETLLERKQLKEGKLSLENFRRNQAKQQNQYESHPALSNRRGMDPKVSNDPNLNNADTNADEKRLVLNYDLRHELRAKPTQTFVPPRPTPR